MKPFNNDAITTKKSGNTSETKATGRRVDVRLQKRNKGINNALNTANSQMFSAVMMVWDWNLSAKTLPKKSNEFHAKNSKGIQSVLYVSFTSDEHDVED
mmetsp:Transcript_4716/g.6471  ORF Transcript_4716/g.6471 Transcript_4716/m.6471 type:complete len:99 (+) Transcript_4716:240-536(+)